eukprot:2435234-Amphidinium_carterae.1
MEECAHCCHIDNGWSSGLLKSTIAKCLQKAFHVGSLLCCLCLLPRCDVWRVHPYDSLKHFSSVLYLAVVGMIFVTSFLQDLHACSPCSKNQILPKHRSPKSLYLLTKRSSSTEFVTSQPHVVCGCGGNAPGHCVLRSMLGAALHWAEVDIYFLRGFFSIADNADGHYE